MTESIGPNDILCGRGGATNGNLGNKKFRALVKTYEQQYLRARKKDKAVIAKEIVQQIHGNGGRFLKRDATSDAWVEVPLKKAISKTSQALREGLDVKNQTLRMSKQPKPGGRSDQPGRVVTGRVSSSASPALVSLQGKPDAVPDLNEEMFAQHPPEPTFMPYQLLLSQDQLEDSIAL